MVWRHLRLRRYGKSGPDGFDRDRSRVCQWVRLYGSSRWLPLCSPHDAWSKTKHVSYYADTTAEILDMAYSYADQTLYALGADSTIYSVDQISGKLQRVAVVSVTCPNMTDPRGLKLTGLTIDDNGTFYVLNHNSNECYLYRFTLDQIVDGAFITGLAPINNTDDGSTGYFGYYGCLAWDHDKDILYMTSGVMPTYHSTSYLVQLDPETGKGIKVNTTYVDNPAYDPATCGSYLNDVVVGLYIVPSSTGSIPSSTEAMGVALDQTGGAVSAWRHLHPDPLVLPMEPDQLRCHLDQLRRDGSHCGRWCGHHGGRWHCHHHSHHGGQAQFLRHL